jgi:hypothetical protein
VSERKNLRTVNVAIVYNTVNYKAVYLIASVVGLFQYLLVEKVGTYEKNKSRWLRLKRDWRHMPGCRRVSRAEFLVLIRL